MFRLLIIPLLLGLGEPVKVVTEPAEETSTYEVRYLYGGLNAKVAKATFTLTPTVFEEKEVYKSDISIRVQPIFRLFMHAQYGVEAFFSRPGMDPVYYTTSTNKGSAWCRYSEGEEGVVFWRQFGKMPEPEIFSYYNDHRTFEVVSLLYFARTHDFEEGDPCDVNVLMGGRKVPSTLVFEGYDTEKYPGHKARILHLHMIDRGIMENKSGQDIYLWTDVDEAHTVLGLQVSLGKRGTMVCHILE